MRTGTLKGFNLIEVMFSILILGIGLVAVASLFPVAGTMQRATYEDVTLMHVESNVRAAMQSRGLSAADLLVGLAEEVIDNTELPIDPPELPIDPNDLPIDPDDLPTLPSAPEKPGVMGDEPGGPTGDPTIDDGASEGGSTADKFYNSITSTDPRALPRRILATTPVSNKAVFVPWAESERYYPMGGEQPTKYVWVPIYQKPNLLLDRVVLHVFILRYDRAVEYDHDIALTGLVPNNPHIHNPKVMNPDDSNYVPLILQINAQQLYPADPSAFVLDYPVRFEVGDLLLDSLGIERHVLEHRVDPVTGQPVVKLDGAFPEGGVGPNYKVWVAQRNGKHSPLKKMITNIENVVRTP